MEASANLQWPSFGLSELQDTSTYCFKTTLSKLKLPEKTHELARSVDHLRKTSPHPFNLRYLLEESPVLWGFPALA